MFIVTIKSIDADSFALPTLYGKTTLQNYNFSMNPQVFSLTEMNRTGPKPFGCFGWVRLEIV